MKSSIIFIALVGAVSSNYAAAADHPNMLRGIIPAELLELGCPETSCNSRSRNRNNGCDLAHYCDTDSKKICGQQENGVCSGCCVPSPTDPSDPTEASEDVNDEYQFEE